LLTSKREPKNRTEKRISVDWLPVSGILKKETLKDNLRAIVAVPAFHEPVIGGVRAIAICWVISVHLVLYHISFFPQQVLRPFNAPWLHFVARGDMGYMPTRSGPTFCM
jgi:hypothetical protein